MSARFLIAVLGVVALAACGLDLVGSNGTAVTGPDGAAVSPDGASIAPPTDGAALVDALGPVDATTDTYVPILDGNGCPLGRGPSMVRIGTYCVDKTEVTEAQYSAFVQAASGRVYPGQHVGCEGKTTHVPVSISGGICRWDPVKNPNLPVVCIDWCDAESFCRWAGKRLCGHIGGGAVNGIVGNFDYKDEAKDQWFAVCSNSGTRTYPYGTGSGSTCNTFEQPGAGVLDVGSLTGCEGGYQGIFDMSGNARELEDSCSSDTASAQCRRRGGGWDVAVASASCDAFSTIQRTDADDATGFRCCAN